MKEREDTTPRVFAIVDVETTGTRPLHDRIIDIAVLRIEDGTIVRTLHTLLHPGVVLSPSIMSLSGITNDMLVRAPQFEDIALELEDILKDAIFVAHNAHFDYGFVKNEFRRIGMAFSAPMLCTVKLSRMLFPHEHTHDLDALIMRHNISCKKRHRAYPDAKVLHDFLTILPDIVSKERANEAIEQLLFADTLPPLLHRNVLKNLPDTSGIYFFYGKEHELLYVGKSKNIRTRVRSHFSGVQSRKELKLCSQTAHVEAVETPGELSALLLESETIKTHNPLYNRALRRARNIVIALEEEAEGYKTLSLKQVGHIDSTKKIAAIFRTMTQARTSLRLLAKTHALCPKLLGIEQTKGACFSSQLGTCSGACKEKESPEEYNKRFIEAFRARAIKSWPYSGPIMIEEKGKTEGVGTVFVVDAWCLVKSLSYDHGDIEEFIPSSTFDYDTYKILARYILNRSNKRSIRVLSIPEFEQVVRSLQYEHEESIAYS